MTLDEDRLKDAERLIRVVMVMTLCTAGVSKFFSRGAFFHYYGEPAIRRNKFLANQGSKSNQTPSALSKFVAQEADFGLEPNGSADCKESGGPSTTI
jgi:hypothetical protein